MKTGPFEVNIRSGSLKFRRPFWRRWVDFYIDTTHHLSMRRVALIRSASHDITEWSKSIFFPICVKVSQVRDEALLRAYHIITGSSYPETKIYKTQFENT